MTIEELLAREAIRQTIVSYTMAGDRLRVDDFVEVFTGDAVVEAENVPDADRFRYEGRRAIHDWMSRWRREAESSAPWHRATFIRHHLSTSQIELTAATTAKARTYWAAYTDIGPDHCGYYVDELRRVDERWLIAHRRVRLDWRSPSSLYHAAVEATRE
jgi:hypothetical protein